MLFDIFFGLCLVMYFVRKNYLNNSKIMFSPGESHHKFNFKKSTIICGKQNLLL